MIIETQYFPCIDYFALLFQQETVYIELYENYQKQSFRNRCQVLSAQKREDLIVPVKKTAPKTSTKDIRLDYTTAWHRQHLGALKANYGKAPFFEYYMDGFQGIFAKKHDFLVDFNTELLTNCLKLLKTKIAINFTKSYEIEVENDFRNKIHPKSKRELFLNTDNITYQQNFGNEFVPNTSIIDLLMCKGPEAKAYIEKIVDSVNLSKAQLVIQ
jgi:hypothetical protein